jgi:hypothetical protein
MEKRGGRKAQITLFIIIGLVLLIIFLLIYFLFIKKPVVKDEFLVEAIPEEFKPVRDYVEGCVHKIGVEAVKKMGAHGGYIDPFDYELTPVLLRFSAARPTRYELVSLTGDADGAVPYYLHVPGDSNYLNYGLGSLAPTIESMQYQMNVYVSRELPKCVGGFESLEEQGFDVMADNTGIITNSLIRDEMLEFQVSYPVNVTKTNIKTKITKYQNTLRFPFKKYYDLAVSMMTAELLTQYLESFTNSLVSYHSGLDPNLLPPVIEYTNTPYVMTWSNSKARNDMNSLLQSYVPVLQVIGTKGYEPITPTGNEVEDGFYNSLSMEIFNDTLPDTAITFFYVPQALKMKIQPSKGELIRPNIAVEKGSQFLPQSEFNTYKFYYDVAYPVIVEIRGDEPNTELPQYSFLFALESNLIENKAALAWNLGMGTVEWDYSYINATYTFPEGSMADEEGKPVAMEPISTAKSLFCDENTWLSGNVSAKVVDTTTGAPLKDVSVSYGCGDYDECWVGSTGENGNWEGKLPLCRGGYLSLSKDGYGSKNIMMDPEEGRDIALTTQSIDRIREVEASVKKYDIQKVYTRNDDWEWIEGADSLSVLQDINSDNEQVILSILQTGFGAGTNPISNTVIFGKDGVDKQSIQLVPGDYEVTATFIDYNGIFITGNCSRVCKLDVLICLNYEYYPNVNFNMTPAPWGGVEIKSETTGLLRITAEQLDASQGIEFRVLKLPNLQQSNPLGGCIEHLEEMNNIADYSTKYKAELMPVFS